MIACVVWMTLAQVTVEAPAFDQTWQAPPARYEVNDEVRTARVVDEATGAEVPCKVQQLRDQRFVFWTRADDGSQPHRYRIEPNVEPESPPPVFVGADDLLAYGRKNNQAFLGVGLWGHALPIDWDEDGKLDLLYSCQDKPQSGVYVYRQIGDNRFEKTDRIGDGQWDCALADMNGDGKVDLLGRGVWFDDIRANGLDKKMDWPVPRPPQKLRAYMGRQVDWDGDGVNDLLTAGGDWNEYGWDDAYDETGNWTAGPLHGFVLFHKNTGTNLTPEYAEGIALEADDHPIDVYGKPSPCAADWDGDGDLDLICAEFRDEFTYFENEGTRTNPRLGKPQPLNGPNGRVRADLCMINVIAHDWNEDGKPDLVVGQEDGRVSIMNYRGMVRGAPEFDPEYFLEAVGQPVKSGALSTPWLDSETGHLYAGNTAGYIERFDWKDGVFQRGVNVTVGDIPFRIMAGYNGSIQGPAEEKWGYTVPCLGDIDNDGEDEIVYNSIIGRIEYLDLQDEQGIVSPPKPVQVAWTDTPPKPAWNWWNPEPNDLAVQWRTRPQVVDWDKDGLNDLIAIDHEGYLALYRGANGMLEPGRRIFMDEGGNPLRLTEGIAGKSGRVKIHLADWDSDGDLDLLRNTKQHTGWFEQSEPATFAWRGDMAGRKIAAHSTCPFALDWNGDGKMDLLVGAEDGLFYCFHRAYLDEPDRVDAREIR